MKHLAVETFSSSHIIPDRGEMMIDYQKQASENKRPYIRSRALILTPPVLLRVLDKVKAIVTAATRSMIIHLVEYIILC